MTHVYDTDITPPLLGSHLIRAALLNQIKSIPKKLTLIQAPPGYGKTAFMSQIRNTLPPPSAWINLRATDNDPVNFIHKLNAAIAQSQDGPSTQQNQKQMGGLAPPSFAPWIRSLVAEMNRSPHFHVYLNDVDFVSNAITLELIESLIQSSHPTVRFFVTATKTIEFSYANLLIENQIASVNQESLRFDRADIQTYYTLIQQTQLSDKTAQTLTDLCEGWPAAISFVVNTLTNQDEIDGFISELSTIQKAFDRYFVERIFEKQSPALQQLMLRLCQLDRFNLPLSHLLSDSSENSQAFAEYIKNHTFITPIDASGKWFRFHQLFNLFLRARAEETLSQEERNRWQLKAAHWFADQHQPEEAIHLAIQANAPLKAATWIEQAFSMVVVGLGKHVTYANWFLSLSDEAIEASPRVRIGYIWSLTARRHYLAVAEQIQWLQQHKNRYDDAIQQEIERTTSLIYCAMKGLQDDATSCDPLITDWIKKWNDSSRFVQQNDYHYEMGLAYLLKGFCSKCLSHFNDARFALNEAHAHFDAYGTYYGKTWAQSLLAVTYAKQGFHHEAQMVAQEGYQNAKEHLGESSHSGYGLAALLAAIHYEHDELELAQAYLTDCMESLKEQSATDLLTAAFETSTRLFMHKQSSEEGLGFLKDGIKWAESQKLERLTIKLIDELIIWLIRLDRQSEAEQYASQYDLIIKSANEFSLDNAHHRIASRSIVMMLIDRQNLSDAKAILMRLLERSKQINQQRKTVLHLALLAVIANKENDLKTAANFLQDSITLATSQSYFRLFIDEPLLHPCINNMARVSKTNTSFNGFLKRLEEKLSTASPQSAPLIEPLTSKEKEIITHLESGRTNKKIAEALFISEGTLKWHLHNIYSKLQVKNRTQALLEGKKQGYL